MTTTERPAPLDAAVMGTAQRRVEGRAKVTGTAPYALEHPVTAPLFAFAVQATIARGRVRRVDTTAAAAAPGVVRVLTFADAPPLADTSDGELAILQDDAVHFRGQLLGVVVAETLEAARAAAALVEL